MKNIERYAFLNTDKCLNLTAIDKQNAKSREYKLWYKGNINDILYHYKTTIDVDGNNLSTFTPSFMRVAPVGLTTNIGGGYQINNFSIYHNPIANIISRAMSSLLFSTSPNISIKARSQLRSKEYQKRFDSIFADNDLASLLQKASEYESYSGAVGFKPIIDSEFSDYPIIQIYPKEEMIINKKYDKLVSIIFMDDFKKENSDYILFSEYGYGFIKYKLIDKKTEKEVSLQELEETSGLQDVYFIDKNTNDLVDVLLAVYKENKPGGRSDYENSIDDFNAIDETYSQMMNYIRKTAPKRVVSESVLKQNDLGMPIVPSVYDQDLIIRWDNNSGTGEETNEVQTTPNLNNQVKGYLDTMVEVQKNIAKTVGLSIKTVMGEDLSGANASADALSIRENVDLRTRDNKIIAWNEALIKLSKLALILDSAEVIGNGEGMQVIKVNSLEEIEILVEFYNPVTPTFKQKAEEVKELLDAGLIDKKRGLYRLWEDLKSEQEIEEMYLDIEAEKSNNIVVEDNIDNNSVDDNSDNTNEDVKDDVKDEEDEDKEGEENVR